MNRELLTGSVNSLIMSLLLISSCYDSLATGESKESDEQSCETDADCSDNTRVDICHSGNCTDAFVEPDSRVTPPNPSEGDSSETEANLSDVDADMDASTALADSKPIDTLCPNGLAERDLIIVSAATLATASGCTKVKGDVLVIGEDIDNIDALSDLTTIKGSLVIHEAPISSLQPLGKLVSIGKDLCLFGLDNLTDLEGLGALTTVGGYLCIREDNLTDLEGLGALTTVGGGLYIKEDNNLVDLHALVNLAPADDQQILLAQNQSLPTCEAKWLVERLGLQMDGSDPNVLVCETVADTCGNTELCPTE